MKKSSKPVDIKLVLHADFDGIVSGYIIQKLLLDIAKGNNKEINTSIHYCDSYNSPDILSKILFETKDKKNTIIYMTDIPIAGGEEPINLVDKLVKKGLHFFLTDHHQTKQNEFLDDKAWANSYYKDSRCASAENLMAILKLYCDKLGISPNDFLSKNSNLPFNPQAVEYLSNEFNKLYSNKKFDNTVSFFKDFFKIFGIKDKKIISFIQSDDNMLRLSKIVNLSWACNLIDFGKIETLDGLFSSMNYWDSRLTQEISKKDSENICHIANKIIDEEMLESMSNLPKSADYFSESKKKIRHETKADDRLDYSLNSAKFYNVWDKDDKKETIAVFVSELDNRFIVEGYRNYGRINKLLKKLGKQPLKVDGVVTFTTNVIGDSIFTHKPVIKKKLSLSKDTQSKKLLIDEHSLDISNIKHNLSFECSSSGIALPYGKTLNSNNDVFKKLHYLKLESINSNKLIKNYDGKFIESELASKILDSNKEKLIKNDKLTEKLLEKELLGSGFSRIEKIELENLEHYKPPKYKLIGSTKPLLTILQKVAKHAKSKKAERSSQTRKSIAFAMPSITP